MSFNTNLPHPSRHTANSKKWVMCEWNNMGEDDNMQFDTIVQDGD